MFYCVGLSSLWMIITDSLFESALFFCRCCSFSLQTILCCCCSSFYALLKYFCLTRTQKRRRGWSIIIIFHFIIKRRFAKRRTALCAIFSWGGVGERLRLRSLLLDLRWPSGHLCACWRTGLWDRSVLIPPPSQATTSLIGSMSPHPLLPSCPFAPLHPSLTTRTVAGGL